MNLLEFRQFFRKNSGRFDLVDETGADTGVGAFIEAGQKYLDRLANLPAGYGRVFKNLSSGQYVVTFKDCRAIIEVWCSGPTNSSDSSRYPLKKRFLPTLQGVNENVLTTQYSKVVKESSGPPLYYSPALLRLITEDGLTGGSGGVMDVLADGFNIYNGIVFMPPSDGNYTIEIIGLFYQTISEDTESNFWTEQHPMILYMSVMRQLEIVHRNSQGVEDFNMAIMEEISTLDKDAVETESSGRSEIDG